MNEFQGVSTVGDSQRDMMIAVDLAASRKVLAKSTYENNCSSILRMGSQTLE